MAWLHGILKGTQIAGYDYCGDPKKLIIVDLDGKFKIFYVSQTLCHMVSMVESCSEKKDMWIQVSEKRKKKNLLVPEIVDLTILDPDLDDRLVIKKENCSHRVYKKFIKK